MENEVLNSQPTVVESNATDTNVATNTVDDTNVGEPTVVEQPTPMDNNVTYNNVPKIEVDPNKDLTQNVIQNAITVEHNNNVSMNAGSAMDNFLNNEYDYDKNELHMRSRNEALVAINRYMTLYDNYTRTEEEEKEFKSLNNQELYYRYNERFPCRLWDLKVGMFLHGDPIVEILEDSRIVVTKDKENNFSYHYVVPTYTYNAYTGNVLI